MIAVVEQLLHIRQVEADRIGFWIIGIDRGQVEVPIAAFGKLVGGKQRIARVGAHGCFKRPDHGLQRGRLNDVEVRRKVAVHHDIDLWPGIGRKDRGAGHQYGLGQDQYIRRHAAVDVHFCETPSIRFDIDEHGREYARNARRCSQNVAE